MTLVKICGLRTFDALDAAIESGADFLGFVFYPRSPRHISVQEAVALTSRVPDHVKTVGLVVDAGDDEIAQVMVGAKIDVLQLHGHEPPQRIAELKNRYKVPVIKAVNISAPEDLVMLGPVQAVADWILFDAKPHDTTALPGGNGLAFDWNLLKNLKITKPWMLSGGLSLANIGTALDTLHPDAVDVSSGVEDGPGQKNLAKIHAFIEAVKRI